MYLYLLLLKLLCWADKDWTKEETDYLFDLVKEYDLRWHVISDRYDYVGGKRRSMEVRPHLKKCSYGS